jgi:2Fe-2S ferredoxin
MKVKFLPQNIECEIEFNETILHLAQRDDIHIQSVCKGIPSCAECRVQIKEGEHHVPPPSSKEISLIGTAHYVDRSRLSCQLRCFGDVTIDLSEQIAKESRATKTPQGRASKPQGEPSHAIKGNIIEEYHEDDNKQLVAEIKEDEVRPGRDHFYDEFKKRRDQNRKNSQDSRRFRDRPRDTKKR